MVCKGEGVDLVFLLMFSPLNRKLHFAPSRLSHIYHKSRPLTTHRCPTANDVKDALAAPRRVRRRCPFCSVCRYNLASWRYLCWGGLEGWKSPFTGQIQLCPRTHILVSRAEMDSHPNSCPLPGCPIMQRPWLGSWVHVHRPDEPSPFCAATSTLLTHRLLTLFMVVVPIKLLC